ncbi:MAG: hypothetical protein ACREA0_05590 [bacterium]
MALRVMLGAETEGGGAIKRLLFATLGLALIGSVAIVGGYFGAALKDPAPTERARSDSGRLDSPAPSSTESPRPTFVRAAPRGSQVRLAMSGLGVAVFGDSPEVAIEELRAVLGPPAEDSGWVDSFSPFGTCPGEYVRGVRWQQLLVLFTDGRTDYAADGKPHFFAWRFGGVGSGRLDLRTSEGIGLGSTVGDLKRAYPGARVSPSTEGDPFGDSFSVPGGTELGFLFGTLTSAADAGLVEFIEYGAPPCGE